MPDFLSIFSDQYEELQATDTQRWIHRPQEKSIDLDSRLAQVVIGVRRSGKSTICIKRLVESGVSFAYINFDDERLYGMQSSDLNDALAALYRVYGQFTHLLLDEVQNVDGWHLFVNRLLRQGLKIVLTGSNANLLSGELSTHLTGRYHQVELLPFSLTEVCSLKGVSPSSLSTKSGALRQRLLDEYIYRGGLPELLTGGCGENYVPSLMSAVVFKDVCVRYRVRYRQVLWMIANLLLDNFCQELSLNELAKRLGVSSVHTVRRYVSFLAEAYLVCLVPKFSFKSLERQLSCKAYAIDPAFVYLRSQTFPRENRGWALENVVYLELRRRLGLESQTLFYLRQPGFEVDFLVSEAGRVTHLVQVTYDWRAPSAKLRRRELGGLAKAARFTGCHNLTLIISEGEAAQVSYDGENIVVCRAADWLTIDESQAKGKHG